MKPTGLNWVNSLSWDLPLFTPMPLWAAPPPVSLTIPCHRSMITGFGMYSDFLHYRILPDHPLSLLLVPVGNLRIRKREWFVGVYTAGESAMGWDWNPGLLRQTGAHDLAVSTEGWGWRARQGVGSLMGWKNMEWGSSEAQKQVQGWAQITGCMANVKWIHEACLHSPMLLLLCSFSFHQRNTD